MTLARRTVFQIAFLIMGLITWGYGQKIDDPTVRLVGIAFFALATMLRFFRSSDTRVRPEEEVEEPEGS